MANILLQYMLEKFNDNYLKNSEENRQVKPFITISREYGCQSRDVADCLQKKLNSKESESSHPQLWQIFSKEIIEKAAKELNVDRKRIEKLFSDEKRTMIDEILNSLSEKYYKSDRLILHTMKKIIRDMANNGHVIIIGRNGVGITQDLKNGLHIRLIAPIEWRVEKLIGAGGFYTRDVAKAHAMETDYKRSIFLKSETLKEPVFDIVFNTQKFTPEDISNIVIEILENSRKNKPSTIYST